MISLFSRRRVLPKPGPRNKSAQTLLRDRFACLSSNTILPDRSLRHSVFYLVPRSNSVGRLRALAAPHLVENTPGSCVRSLDLLVLFDIVDHQPKPAGLFGLQRTIEQQNRRLLAAAGTTKYRRGFSCVRCGFEAELSRLKRSLELNDRRCRSGKASRSCRDLNPLENLEDAVTRRLVLNWSQIMTSSSKVLAMDGVSMKMVRPAFWTILSV